MIDVLSNRKMLDMILKRKGFSNTEQCADGLEAVALVKEKGLDYYDLIFMDSSMPVMVRQPYSLTSLTLTDTRI